MKKRITALILIGVTAFSIHGCGQQEAAKSDDTEADSVQQEVPAETNENVAEEEFSFEALKNLEFWFCSGAGGWATTMTIDADGSFSGEYFDGDLGVTGDGYPNGTMYQCDFRGQFTQPEKVNDYTYSMEISALDYEQEPGTEEMKDGMLYCYSEPYGLDGAEKILIYLPGAPLLELSEEFRSWVGYYDLSGTEETELPFYALNNEAQQYGFYSQNIIEDAKAHVASVEVWAAELENSISQDSLSQMELNEKSKELYDLWDGALNDLWNVLKQTLDEEAMNALTVEEREWIAKKEQEAAEAGAEAEGGSMQPMVMDLKAAELTKERVYELLELLD